MSDIIVNIKTEEEFDHLIKRLSDREFYKGRPGEVLSEIMHSFHEYDLDLCLRLSGKMVNHDQVAFYQKHYSYIRILSVDEYYALHDKEYNLNKKMMKAIKIIMEKRHAR